MNPYRLNNIGLKLAETLSLGENRFIGGPDDETAVILLLNEKN